jgi:hypothetical protein
LVTLLTAIAALFTAFLTLTIINQNYAAQKTNLLFNIADSYAKKEIGDSLNSLKKFSDKFQNKDELQEGYRRLKIDNDEKFSEYDQSRRLISHHYFKIWRMRLLEIIDNDTVRILAPLDEIKFLLHVIENLHLAKDPNYDKRMYTFFRALYPELNNFE